MHTDVHAGECMIERKGWPQDLKNHIMHWTQPHEGGEVLHLVGVSVLGSNADDAWYNSHSIHWNSSKMLADNDLYA